MKSKYPFILLIFIITFGKWSCTPSQDKREENPPNIVFILTDDQGWSCTSLGMDDRISDSKSDFFETPNIDRLAKEGIRFTRGYAPASICSPTRRSIQFGMTPARLGDESFKVNYNPELHPQHLSIPKMLKSVNPHYKTAHYGKWDLRAEIFPEDLGYDESDGDTRNRHGNLMSGPEEKWAEVFISDDPKRIVSITERALNFMERQVKQGNPFYLQVSHYAPHVDIQTRQETFEKYEKKPKGKKHHNPGWAGMLEDMDQSVGDILDKINELGIGDNTYVIFMSDNGAAEFIPPVPARQKLLHPDNFDKPMRNYPLRGGKWNLYEGGIRVPFIVKGPDIAAGIMSHEPVAGWDLLPTMADMVSYRSAMPGELDGGSFFNILKSAGQGKVKRNQEFLVFHRYNKGYPHTAIMKGEYKAIQFWKTGKAELYHLGDDLGEIEDISESKPEILKDLLGELVNYIEAVNPDLLLELKGYLP
ncbi:MAG: sulfatase [Cyclobacteriaceae bacterium]|nr:sulfatase [Cyclobacteriaceae bacterium]